MSKEDNKEENRWVIDKVKLYFPSLPPRKCMEFWRLACLNLNGDYSEGYCEKIIK